MTGVIILGGHRNTEFLKQRFKQYNKDVCYIAADAGLETIKELNIVPDIVVGDFDTVNKEILSKYKNGKTLIREFNPEKDFTDSEIALFTAIDNGADIIHIYGATGGRIDHLMGNIALLAMGYDKNISVTIFDEYNKVSMIGSNTGKPLALSKDEYYNKYLSLISYDNFADIKNLEGVKYPLKNFRLIKDTTLGISNEITENEATIDIENGRLLVIWSRD